MTVVKMVGKQVENISEIRAQIKVCTKIGHFVRQIFTEMGEVNGSDKVNVYETVRSCTQSIPQGDIEVYGM